MCETCNSIPCKPDCPENGDFYPQRVCYRCYECGEPIYEDDLYLDYDGIEICQQCVDEHMVAAVYSGGEQYDD